MDAITKTAVDKNAEEYWIALFGAYGKQWVRQLPNLLKKAVLDDLTSKSKRANKDNPNAEGEIAALAHTIHKDGVVLEGVFKGSVSSVDGETLGVRRLFCAHFNHDGQLTKLDSVVAP